MSACRLPGDEYAALCNDAGIDSVEDFLLFSQPELQKLGFRLGHIKRIFVKLGRPVTGNIQPHMPVPKLFASDK